MLNDLCDPIALASSKLIVNGKSKNKREENEQGLGRDGSPFASEILTQFFMKM